MSLGAGSVTILEAAGKFVSAGFYTTTAGPATFARVHRVGWYGVGFDGGGLPAFDLITWSRFLANVYEDFRLTGLNIFGDTMFWDMIAGASIEIEVDW